MKTEEMICELRRLEEVHKDDFVGTCETNWSLMCRDVANRLEELLMAQMMTLEDLIPRAAAIEAFNDERVDRNYGDVSPESVIKIIESIPAVDAVPMVHGRWSEKRWMTDDDWGVINHRAIVCSACKGEIADGEKTCYCPNCGAKMDKEK